MRLSSFILLAVTSIIFFVEPAFAEEAAAASSDWGKLAAGLGIAIAALGGALGQGKVASSALEGISRNPGASGQMFVPLLLGLVFIETLVLFTFVITNSLK